MADQAPLADRIAPAPPGADHDLVLDSQYEKEGWQARVGGDLTHAPHPGTAVDYDGRVYEVLRTEPAPGPFHYRYVLKLWEDRFIARRIFPYTPETQRAAVQQIQEDRRQYRQHAWIVYLFPLSGLLPTPVLERWERLWGLPMRKCSIASVVFLAIVAMTVGPALDKAHPGSPWVRLLFLLQVEQMIRAVWLIGSNQAVGSFWMTAAYGLWSLLRGRKADGTPRRRGAAAYQAERDEVRPILGETSPWQLEVRSLFRDPLLMGKAPVRYSGEVFEPLGCIQEGEGLSRRYVFRLKRLSGVDPARARREYSPERDAARIAALLPYERKRDRVHAWAFFCGFLPAAHQQLLEAAYEYPAELWTRRSALVVMILAALWLAMRWPPQLLDLASVYFIAESLYRWLLSRARGEPAGSALGWLILPLL
jgi:hypothetical protein